MRKVKCWEIHGMSLHELLNEFNERRDEFGVPDEDIISMSSGAPLRIERVHTPDGSKDATVRLVIFYWSDK